MPVINLHVDLKSRLRSIVSQALDGSAYQDSHAEPLGMLVIDAVRPDGAVVHVRFRGVRDSESTAWPERGALMRLKSVGSAQGFSVIGLLVPRVLRGPSPFGARVRLDAGAVRIEIVCQDAEWWVDPPAGMGATGP